VQWLRFRPRWLQWIYWDLFTLHEDLLALHIIAFRARGLQQCMVALCLYAQLD